MNDSHVKKNWLVGCALFLMFLSVIPIWLTKYFPTQNAPEYLLLVHMIKEFYNPTYNYYDYYELIPIIVPNILFHFLIYLLYFFFSILTCHKIALSLMILLFPLSVFYFICAVDPRRIVFGFVSFIYTYNYFIFKGYENFYVSLSLFFIFLGYLIKHKNSLSKRNYTILYLLAFLLYLSHIYTFLLAIFIITVYSLIHYKSSGKFFSILAVFIPGFLFFLFYITNIFQNSGELVTETTHWLWYAPVRHTLGELIDMTMYSFSSIPVLILWVSLLFIIFSIIKHLWGIRLNFHPSKIGLVKVNIGALLQTEMMTFFSIMLFLLYWMMPREIAGWSKFNIRILPFLLIFMMASARPFSKKIILRGFLILSMVSSIFMFAFMSYYIPKKSQKVEVYTSGVSYIKQNRTILPVFIDDEKDGKIRFLNWAFNYYNIYKGGATGLFLAYMPGRIIIKYKKPVQESFPRFDSHHPEKADMKYISSVYDYVLFWGDDRTIFELFKEHGFQCIFQKGKLKIYGNWRLLANLI